MEPKNWRKSSRSGGIPDSDCVEVAFVDAHDIAVRDSKNTAGPTLEFAPDVWWSFLRGVSR